MSDGLCSIATDGVPFLDIPMPGFSVGWIELAHFIVPNVHLMVLMPLTAF